MKGLLKEYGEMTEKLNDFFASVFNVEDVRHIPMSQPLFLAKKSQKN